MRIELIVFTLIFSFTAFLLSFPNFGPTALALINEHGLDARFFFTAFFIPHIAGILVAGLFVDYTVRRMRVARVVAIGLIAATFALNITPLAFVPVIGFLLGILVVLWGSLIARMIKPWKRGKILALSAALANVFLFFMSSLDLPAFHLTALSAFSITPVLLFQK